MKSIVTALLLSTSVKACLENIECELQLGRGACCLTISSPSDTTTSCKDETFVNYYTQGPNYNPETTVWTNPNNNAISRYIYCAKKPAEADSPFKFMYPQPFKEDRYITTRDSLVRNV